MVEHCTENAGVPSSNLGLSTTHCNAKSDRKIRSLFCVSTLHRLQSEEEAAPLIAIALWFVLLLISWPLALITLVLWPIIWLILLPFRLLGLAVDAVFETLRAILMLPARLLRGPSRG